MPEEPKQDGGIAEAMGLKALEWTDRVGRRHVLPVLTNRDMAELEAEFGLMRQWPSRAREGAKIWSSTLWRSLRKEGLVRKEIRAGQWRLNLQECAELIPIGTEACVRKDLDGNDQTFHPLTLLDLIELEGGHGSFQSWADGEVFSFGFIESVLWMALRKQGKMPEQIAKGEHAITKEEAGDLFAYGVAQDVFPKILHADKVQEIGLVWIELLSRSGIRMAEPGAGAASDPPPPPAGEAKAGVA